MPAKSIFAALLLSAGLINTTAHAAWQTNVKDRTLIITSGEDGTESIAVYNFLNSIMVLHGQTGDMKFFSPAMFDRIEFIGDKDDDRFENLTAIPVTAWGGKGNDVLIGGSADDDLFGEEGFDEVIGNEGNDLLHAGEDLFESRIDGGEGQDQGIIWRVLTRTGRVPQVFMNGFELGGQKHDRTVYLPAFDHSRPSYPAHR